MISNLLHGFEAFLAIMGNPNGLANIIFYVKTSNVSSINAAYSELVKLDFDILRLMIDGNGIGNFAGVVVNVRDLDTSLIFWSRVLGVQPSKRYSVYAELPQSNGVGFTLQQVESELENGSSTHIDIKVDDNEAAIKAVELLGGKLVERMHRGRWQWAVMSDPDGNVFCLV